MGANVTTNRVIEAISIALSTILPQAKVYGNRIPQGVVPGTFVIREIGQAITPAIGVVDLNDGEFFPRRSLRRPTLEVRYYPVSDEQQRDEECRDVEELLIFALMQIKTVDGCILAAEDMQTEIVDGVLHMTADYPYLIEDTRYAPPMEHMDYSNTDPKLWNETE